MDREQAKKLLPIIQAFAKGKIIQSRRINGMWIDLEMKTALNIISLIDEPQKYRIKPEPKFRQFKNAEECWQEMQKHRPFGWLCNKINNQYYYITALDDYGIVTTPFDEIEYTKYTDIIKRETTFADGAPFGIKE